MEVNEPYFSVIVPAHNASGFIRKCLDSIRSQTYPYYELIVVCDNCTDDTAKICRDEYKAKVIETDYGLDGLARNAGIDAAANEWILFLDHDDWWIHEYVLQQIADAIQANYSRNIDMLLFDFIWKGVRYHSQRQNGVVIAVWCKCWRRSFIGDVRFSDMPHWSDVGFMRTLWARHPVYAFLDKPVYYYNYLVPGSISWQEKEGMIESYKGG